MTAIVAVLVLITFLAFYNVRLADLNRQLSTSAQESDKQKRHTQRLLYASDVKLAKQALDEHDLPQLTMLLKRHEPVEDAPDERGFAWHYLQQQTRVKQFDLPKHPGAIYAVCYSQDGRKIATAGSDATVRIFDAESHSELDLFATGQGEVNGIAFSPDGQTLATTGDDGTVRIWDVLSHRSLQTIQSTAGEAYETLFAPDGEQLVTTGNETRVHIWDPSTGRLLRSLEGHTRSAQAVAISADGRTLGTASDDGTVKLWEFPAGVELRTIKASIDRLVTIDFSRNGRWVATGGVDRKIDVWETASGSHIVGFEHLDGIQSVAFSTDDKWIAAGDRGGTVHIWPIDAHDDSQPDKKKRQPIVWQAHTGRISLIRFSPDGRQLITVGRDGAVTVWHPFSQSTHRTVDAPDRAFHGMAFTPDGQSLLTIDGSGEVLSWDPTIEKTHSTLFRHASALNSITVSPTGAFLAAGDSRGRVLLGDLKTEDLNIPSPLSILDDQERGSVFDLTFSPNGRALAVGSAPSTIFVIDLVTRESIPGLTNISGNSPVFSPDGRQLALRVDNRVDVWDTSTCKILFVLRGHAGSVAQVAYNPNGRTIATASDDRTVKFWNATDGTELSSIVGHRSPVSCLAFSPQGRSLLSADRDGAIKIWQIATGSELMELERRQGFCMKMLFSVDGRRLACYRTDSSIVVTDLNTQNGGMVDDSTDDRTLSSKTLFEARLHQHVVRKLDRMPPNLGLSRSQQRQTFRGHTGPVTCVDVSDDGNLIASGSHDATVRIWDRHSGALKRTLESQSGRITAVAFQPESALLAVAYEDRSVRVWDLNARGVVTQFAQRDHEIIGLRFNNAGDQLLVAELDGKVTLWDVKSAKALQTISSRLSLHEGFLMDYDEQGHAWLAGRTSQGLVTVRSIAPESVEFEINESVPLCFNLDRSLLVTRGLGYRFAAVGLWDVNRARSIMTLRGHGSQVLGAAFSPDGQLLVTTSSDRTIRVWDVTTGDMRQILTGHCGAVRSPVFTPDGRDLVTCSDDKTVRLWSVTGQSPQRHDSENVQ
jgi:WD40 repeat protein